MALVALALVLMAVALYWASQRIVAELKSARDEAARTRAAMLMELFARGKSETSRDPRALLVWYPLAKMARALDPEMFASFDRTIGRPFPFSNDEVQAAHAQWTADWLAWERTHDAEYKLKAAAIEVEWGVQPSTSDARPLLRARLDAVEREKLDLYQRRYQEYVQVAKALQALT